MTGAVIKLALRRFGKTGKLCLPNPQPGAGPMPRLHIDNGTLTLNQNGRPPMVVHGITADLIGDGAGLTAKGSVSDPFWGEWSLDGSLVNETGAINLTLAAKSVTVDKAHLTGLPFVAPAVWRSNGRGRDPLRFQPAFGTRDDPAIHYRVALAPTDAHVHVESIELDAVHASGTVVVADNLVHAARRPRPLRRGRKSGPTPISISAKSPGS